MQPSPTPRWHQLRSLWPYAVLTVVLASGLLALDHLHTSGAPPAPSSFNEHSAGNIPPCGAQLAIAGYSITLSTSASAARTAQSALSLSSSDIAAEFQPLTSSSPALAADPAAQSLGLGRMQVVNTAALGPMSQSALLARLQSAAGVAYAEPMWLQSSDKQYLACDYRLEDNATDQALAKIARDALVAAGISAATLDDTATMEFVSLRHFNGRQLLQVAFVRRVVGTPSVAYVAMLDPGTRTVLATVQANWYLWG